MGLTRCSNSNLLLLLKSLTTDEIDVLVKLGPESSATLERRHVRVQVLAPEGEELLDTKGPRGIVAALLHIEFLSKNKI